MKYVIGILVSLIGIVLGIYVGGWLMFIKPIMFACKAYDAGTLSAVTVGVTVIKCALASVVGTLLMWVGTVAGAAIMREK